MINTRTMSEVTVGLALSLLIGCASTERPLMPTPALYQQAPALKLFGDLPPEQRKAEIDLLYVTNRRLQDASEQGVPYGEQRAHSLAFGGAIVEVEPPLSWDELERQSRLAERTTDVALEMGRVDEIGRFPNEPYAVEATASGMKRTEAVLTAHERAKSSFAEELRRRLEKSHDGEVMLYIHGFNETFATAAYTAAELCHFLGREHVCTFFTWPASASGGFLTAYTSTTESAEFAVSHLAKTIRLLGQTPGVRALHLLAHSRGAAVLLSALRELAIASIAAGIDPVDVLKVRNVVLMSPDIDAEVARQKLDIFSSNPDLVTRWSSDRLPRLISGRLTVYASPADRALLASTILFRSRKRVGRFSPADIPQAAQDYFGKWGNIDLVVYQGKSTDRFGHSYFSTNPDVSADLIQLVRFDRAPGEPGRPLIRKGPAAWTFPDRK